MLAEWIAGQDVAGDHFLTHTKFPRFVARLAEPDELRTGTQIQLSSGEWLSDIMWLDECRQDEAYLLALADAASMALYEIDEIALNEAGGEE